MEKQIYPEPVVGALIVGKAGKLLLFRSPKFGGKFIVPGGHIEVGETIEGALKREVKEETGLEIEPVELIAFYNAVFPPDFFEKRHFIFFDFLCRVRGGKLKVDGKELSEAVWVEAEEALEKLELEAYTRKTIEDYLRGKKPGGNDV